MNEKKMYGAALLLAVLAYCGSLLHFSLNVPKVDDYLDVLHFLNEYLTADGWAERFRLIFSQTNEHRTVFSHLVYLSIYGLFDEINFRVLMFVGNLAVLGLVALLAWHCREAPALPITAFIAVYILNFQYWNSMFWAMASIENFWVLLLAAFSISCVFHKAKWAFAAACLAAVLASFTQGNGLLIWFVGGLCLLHRNGFRRRHVQLGMWCLLAVTVAVVYFWGFNTADETIFKGIERRTGVLRAIIWFLSFLGAGVIFDSQSISLAVSCGLLVLALSIWSFFFFLARKPAVAYTILFLVMSALVATGARYSLFEFSSALSSRYKIYSSCLSALALVALLLRYRSTRFGKAIQVSFMAFALAQSTVGYATGIPALNREQLSIVNALQRWLLTANNQHVDFILRSGVEQQLQKAIETKVWDPRHLFPDMLSFSRKRSAVPCGASQGAPLLPYTWQRTPGALVGELQFMDASLGFDHFASIVVCRGERTYAAPIIATTRRPDGVLVLHYLILDSVEKADALFVQGGAGTYYRADFRPADTLGRN